MTESQVEPRSLTSKCTREHSFRGSSKVLIPFTEVGNIRFKLQMRKQSLELIENVKQDYKGRKWQV